MTLDIHVFGAGHVAKALMSILGQLNANIHWVDSRENEFPATLPNNTRKIVLDQVLDHIPTMGANAYSVILTHNHALDYQLVCALLDRQDCHYIGVIGSKTKANRFRKRLSSESFSDEEIKSVYCPIGITDVPGKLPMEVAVSISAQLIQQHHKLTDYQQDHRDRKEKGPRWLDVKNALTTIDSKENSKV